MLLFSIWYFILLACTNTVFLALIHIVEDVSVPCGKKMNFVGGDLLSLKIFPFEMLMLVLNLRYNLQCKS